MDSIGSKTFIDKVVEKRAEAGGAPIGARFKLCEGDTRIRRIQRAIIIIDIYYFKTIIQ